MGVIYEAIYKLTYVVSYIPVALFLELTIYDTTHASQKLETGLSLLPARG